MALELLCQAGLLDGMENLFSPSFSVKVETYCLVKIQNNDMNAS